MGTACKEGLDCLILVHNERRILEEFFRYYRLLGVTRFLVVDDRSTDGSSEWLRAQPDALVFTPVDGTQYKTHKKQWRSEILDTYCADRWVFVPDADELFVYKDMETKPVAVLIQELEAEGARALPALMVDMYRDAPLTHHHYVGGSLLEAFPLFDGEGYYQFPVPSRSLTKLFPCPWFMYAGGMRHRIFNAERSLLLPFANTVFQRYCDLGKQPWGTPSGLRERLVRAIASWYCFGFRIKKLQNVAKLPLVKWVRGLRFSGGAHAISADIPVSSKRSVLLHFKFTAGLDQIRYIAERGEHAKGSRAYHHILENERLSQSPASSISRRYQDSASLGALLR